MTLKLRLTLTKTSDLSVTDDDLLASLNEKLLEHGCEPGDTATSDDIEAAVRLLWEEDPTGLIEIFAEDLEVELLSGSFVVVADKEGA